MVEEARLEKTERGTVPVSEGWFAVHASEVPWVRFGRFGIWAQFEGEHPFPDTGVHLCVLEPGRPACLYHRENAQEDFFVISGECTLIVEEQERPLRAGHFVHCPAGTRHVFVGAGKGPCAMLMIGHRRADEEPFYPFSEAAGRYGASVGEDTADPRKAYEGSALEPVDPMWPL